MNDLFYGGKLRDAAEVLARPALVDTTVPPPLPSPVPPFPFPRARKPYFFILFVKTTSRDLACVHGACGSVLSSM